MTMQEVIENELKCVQRDCCRLENECAKCDLVLSKEEIINAYNKALRLEKENAELKAKIEKLKCCENCRFSIFDTDDLCVVGCNAGKCFNHEKWELQED